MSPFATMVNSIQIIFILFFFWIFRYICLDIFEVVDCRFIVCWLERVNRHKYPSRCPGYSLSKSIWMKIILSMLLLYYHHDNIYNRSQVFFHTSLYKMSYYWLIKKRFDLIHFWFKWKTAVKDPSISLNKLFDLMLPSNYILMNQHGSLYNNYI